MRPGGLAERGGGAEVDAVCLPPVDIRAVRAEEPEAFVVSGAVAAGVRRGGAEDDRAGGDEEDNQQRGDVTPQAARRVRPAHGRG